MTKLRTISISSLIKILIFSLSVLLLGSPNSLHSNIAYAQSGYDICQSLTIDAASPIELAPNEQMPNITVTAVLTNFSGFDPNNFRFYMNPWGTGRYVNKSIESTVNSGNIIVRAVFPSADFQTPQNGTIFGFYIENVSTSIELKKPGTEELCMATIQTAFDPQEPRAGSCASHGFITNHAYCSWTGNAWSASTLDYYCQSDSVPVCYSNPIDPDLFPPEFQGGFCAPCVQNLPEIRSWGESCNPEIIGQCGQLTCRGSQILPGLNLCLYPANYQEINDRCIKGENECKTLSETTSFPLVCGTATNRPGDRTQCKIVQESCNEEVGALCPTGFRCVDYACEVIPPTGNTTPYYTPATSPPPPTSSIDPGKPFEITTCDVRTREDAGIYTTEKGIKTSFGCIPISISGLTRFIFRIALGIGGGIAFLLIIFGGVNMMMSTGDPKKLQESKELLTSAIVGLLLILFSVFILRLIGYNILAIPGFG